MADCTLSCVSLLVKTSGSKEQKNKKTQRVREERSCFLLCAGRLVDTPGCSLLSEMDLTYYGKTKTCRITYFISPWD